jgi:DNA-binding response OmpR family regulator
MNNTTILLVEDDPSLGFAISDNLNAKEYDVTWCRDGEKGLIMFNQKAYDLCILDIMLPKKDGLTLAKEIRLNNASVPILFLTAKSMLEDKLEGFRVGADDFICKPFNLEELLYRMEVFLRRRNSTSTPKGENVIKVGAFEFEYTKHLLKHESGIRKLTSKEAILLLLLYSNRDRILKREEMLTAIWGDDDYFIGRSMDVFISKLRKYLKADPAVQVVNYHGIGFRLEGVE